MPDNSIENFADLVAEVDTLRTNTEASFTQVNNSLTEAKSKLITTITISESMSNANPSADVKICDYPYGYNNENSYILSQAIHLSSGQWMTMNHNPNLGLNIDGIHGYSDNSRYNGLPIKIVLAKY